MQEFRDLAKFGRELGRFYGNEKLKKNDQRLKLLRGDIDKFYKIRHKVFYANSIGKSLARTKNFKPCQFLHQH
jgi:hypothetical protein